MYMVYRLYCHYLTNASYNPGVIRGLAYREILSYRYIMYMIK